MTFIKLRDNCVINPETIHGVRIISNEKGIVEGVRVLSFGREVDVEPKYIPEVQKVVGESLQLPLLAEARAKQASIPFHDGEHKEKKTRNRGAILVLKFKDHTGNTYTTPRKKVFSTLRNCTEYIGESNRNKRSQHLKTGEHFTTKNGEFTIQLAK